MQEIPADSLAQDSVLTDSAAIVPAGPIAAADTVATLSVPEGVEGELLPYRLHTDDCVLTVLMLCFFVTSWVLARSWHSLSNSMADFFHTHEHNTGFTEASSSRLRILPLMMVQTCILLGMLFFCYMQERMSGVSDNVPPYTLLGGCMGLCLLYCLLKSGVSHFVNTVFFGVRKAERWMSSYHFLMFVFGVLLFPQVLLAMYSSLSFTTLLVLFLSCLAVVKILLFYKSFSIFFNYEYGYLHLFLYFCTLEILPLLVLWHGLVSASTYLTTLI